MPPVYPQADTEEMIEAIIDEKWNDLMSDNAVQGNPFGFRFDTLDIGSDNPRGVAPGADSSPVIRGPFGTVTGSSIRGGTTATIE